MENKHLAQNNPLALSLEGAPGPEIDAPSRFARALKQARFRKGWTQAKLAVQLGITKRTIVSWETATRIPSIGMVLALLAVLSDGELSLHHELLYSYILDDLEDQIQRKDPEGRKIDSLARQLQQVFSHVERLAANQEQPSLPQSPVPSEVRQLRTTAAQRGEVPAGSSGSSSLEPLFTLLDQLRRHPDLIPVANDFVREMVPEM